MTIRMGPIVMLLAAGFWSPASGQIMVVGSSVQEREARAGDRYTGEIRLRNQGEAPKQVRVYQTDYLFYADGSNLYPAPGTHPRSNAGWLTVTPTDLVVPGRQEALVAYEVIVPDDPGAVGTYWSMIMVEPVDPVRDSDAGGEPSIGVQTTIRFGIQVATHLEGEAPHRLGLGDPRVVPGEAGTPNLEFELINEGDVAFRPLVALEIYDQTGALRGTFEAQRGLIYPGSSVLQRFDLEALSAGDYQAILVVDTGGAQLFGGQFTVAIDAPG